MKKLCVCVVFVILFLSGCGKKEIASDAGGGVPALTSEEMMLNEENAARMEEQRRRELREQDLQGMEMGQGVDSFQGEHSVSARQQGLMQDIESKRIFFDFDSFVLNEEGRNILQHVASVMREYQNLRLRIEGHCDERGTSEYNMALGERRARTVLDFLVVLGVGSDRLEVLSFGEEQPLDLGHTESAWAMNRRADFYFLK